MVAPTCGWRRRLSMRKPQRYLAISGVAVLVAFVSAVQILGHVPFDTPIRDAARSAVTATGFLEIIWATAAALFAAMRWRVTTWPFRAILSLNLVIACLLIRELFR